MPTTGFVCSTAISTPRPARTATRRAGATAAIAFTALALAASVFGPAPAASAGPAATDSALEEILRLQRQGDQVIVHRRGDKPLQMCVVTAIRQRSAQYVWTRPRIIDPRPGKRPTGVGVQLIIRTLDVDVQC